MSVCVSVCLSVYLWHIETPTSGGRVDLWSKIAFQILVWDDTIFQKKWGSKTVRFKNLGNLGIFFSPTFFGKLCHPRPILGTQSSTRGLHDLRKWVFRDGTDMAFLQAWPGWKSPAYNRTDQERNGESQFCRWMNRLLSVEGAYS